LYAHFTPAELPTTVAILLLGVLIGLCAGALLLRARR